MRAYKASYDGKCLSITYEVGKSYTFNGKIEMCKTGFHFCLSPKDLMGYYHYSKNLVVFEIEVEDGNYKTEGNKSVTNSFKVIRKVKKSEYKKLLDIKLNSKGQPIWKKDSNGNQQYYKYDSKGNLIWFKNSSGEEQSYKYDSKNRLIWQEGFGTIVNYKYDSKGNKIWQKTSEGYEWKYKYDSKGNLISEKDFMTATGLWAETKYKYDSKSNRIWSISPNGYEENYKYDSEGRLIWSKNSDGYEVNYKYDSNGNIIEHKSSTGFEEIFTYDSKGNLIKGNLIKYEKSIGKGKDRVQWKHLWNTEWSIDIKDV